MMFGLFKKNGVTRHSEDENKKISTGKSQNKAKKKNNALKIPEDVLDTIPYQRVYKNGMFKNGDDSYSKAYLLKDVNFKTENMDVKENLYLQYENVLNTLSPEMTAQLLIFNRNIDQDTVRNDILMKPKDDGMNDLREEWNDYFLSKLQSGQNNLSKEKMLVVSAKAEDQMAADNLFKTIDENVNTSLHNVVKDDTVPMTMTERLHVLYDIMNTGTDLSFEKKISSVMKDGELDIERLNKSGITTKELVAPDSFTFYPSSFKIGDQYAEAFYIDHLPNSLHTDFLDTVTNISCNMLMSITYVPVKQDAVMKLMKSQTTAINAQIATATKDSARDGMYYVPQELEQARDATKELMGDIVSRDQKMFKTTAICILIAKDKEELLKYKRSLSSVVNGTNCQIRTLSGQQELAFDTALPLAENRVTLTRMLSTEAACVFMPFSVTDIYQKGGIYYGVNAISKSMIRYNRRNGSNYNGLIIGKSGSGKSFLTKEEIMQKMLGTDERIIIIDPEGEYTNLALEMKGQVIPIDTSNRVHINPLDMDMQYGGEEENPISMKSDFLLSLVEIMVGGEGNLSPIDKTIILRAARKIYKPYYNYMREQTGKTIDVNAMPTLGDFYDALISQKEPSAQIIATAIEDYVTGVNSVFAHRTDVDMNNRLIVYNVKNMPANLKEVAMQICLNDAWLHILHNGTKGYYTNLYIDEFHLFTRTKTSAAFMRNIYKRARKWHGIPTAITQNVGDLLVNDEAAALINNCDFVLMMNQSPMDRAALANMYNISTTLQDYINDKGFGVGLMYNGKTIVPFENSFNLPNSRSYQIMDSNVKKTEKKKEESTSDL